MRLVCFCHIIASLILTSTQFARALGSQDDSANASDSRVRNLKNSVTEKTAKNSSKPKTTSEDASHTRPNKSADKNYRFPTRKKMALKRQLKAQGFEETQIPQYEIPPFLSREDLNKIVPKDVTPQDSKEEVLRKMSDKAVQVWLKSPTMQSMAVVQTAQKVEEAMKAEVALGSADEEGGIQHKFNFQIQAFQTTSKIDYTGYVNASVSYNLRDQRAGVEVREKIFKGKDLFLNHSTTRDEHLSTVGMKWSF